MTPDQSPHLRVLLLGGSGTIGRATARALRDAGHDVTAPLRSAAPDLPGVNCPRMDVTDPGALARLMAEGCDAVVSCLASRTGSPADAWAIDHAANSRALQVACTQGVSRFVHLSAICVQRPELPFQQAKLAFEAELQVAPVNWTIVRPTAFFKSLSGQVARVAAGRPFLVFGDGRLTACKPISDTDLGTYLARALTDPDADRRILMIGGPGPAITPADQAQMLARLLGRPVPVRRVPVAMMTAIIGGLSVAGLVSARMRDKAGLARIGRYYATQSMLVWDAQAGRYDADATPEFGQDWLEDHYAAMLRGDISDDRGAHAVF